jgi:hypothetical protein
MVARTTRQQRCDAAIGTLPPTLLLALVCGW